MKTYKMVLSAAVIAAAAILTGCRGTAYDKKFDLGTQRAKIDISKAAGPVRIDGVLDEKEWAGATVHKIQPAYVFRDKKAIPPKVYANMNKKDNRVEPFQGGTVRLMYDDKYLYVGACLEDSDVMQYGKIDQNHFYLSGDVLEMFLKPANAPSYWECYGTPNSKKTSLFFDTRRYPLHPVRSSLMPGMIVSTKVNGTFNDYTGKPDKGWTIEVAFPREQLAKTGRPFTPGEPWTILIARYNYNYGSVESNPHFSTYPELPVVNYHHLEYYANVNWK